MHVFHYISRGLERDIYDIIKPIYMYAGSLMALPSCLISSNAAEITPQAHDSGNGKALALLEGVFMKSHSCVHWRLAHVSSQHLIM